MKLSSDIELHSKIRNISIEYDKLVVGSTLEALAYAFLNNIPLVCCEPSPPKYFEAFNVEQDLSVFGIQNTPHLLKLQKGEEAVGIQKSFLWARLFFCLSVGGLIPLSDKAVSLRISNNTLKAFTSNARMAKFSFNKLIVFDDKGVYGLGTPSSPQDLCTVYDWFNVRSGMKHSYDILKDDSDFVNQIYFYPSPRVEGEHNFKDALAVSHLSKEMLSSYYYSEINARFKVLHMMKKNGIKGARNGRDMRDKTKFKYYAVKIENDKRDIVKPRNIYESTSNIIFNYDSFNDIMIKYPLQDSYVTQIVKFRNRS